jgi:hypothetical protein
MTTLRASPVALHARAGSLRGGRARAGVFPS